MSNEHPSCDIERSRLATEHLRLASAEARRFGRSDEWLSECYLALVEAAASWDPALGVPFPAWARHLIRLRTKRRITEQRVIKVPARVMTRIAALIEELDRGGHDLSSPTTTRHDQTLVSALNALSPATLDGIDAAVDEANDIDDFGEELSETLRLRYGFDGGGMRSVREVAAITGVSVPDVLREDATYINTFRSARTA